MSIVPVKAMLVHSGLIVLCTLAWLCLVQPYVSLFFCSVLLLARRSAELKTKQRVEHLGRG